jgi:hypothetical protein
MYGGKAESNTAYCCPGEAGRETRSASLERRRSTGTGYQTDLNLYPNRFDALYGAARAAEAAGKQADAMEYCALLLKVCDGSNSTRPELSRARQFGARE